MRSWQVAPWRTALALSVLLLAAASAQAEKQPGLGRRALAGVSGSSPFDTTRKLGTFGNTITSTMRPNTGSVSLTLGTGASTGATQTAQPTTAPVSLSITSAKTVSGVTGATNSVTTPQLQVQSSPFGMSFFDRGGTEAASTSASSGAAASSVALTGRNGGTALGQGLGTMQTGASSWPAGGTLASSASLGSMATGSSQPCNAMSTYSAPADCGRVPVASLAPTPVPTAPAGPVWVPV